MKLGFQGYNIKTSSVIVLVAAIVLLCSFSKVWGQSPFRLENAKPYNKEMVSPFLRNLHDTNDYVVSFRVKLTGKDEQSSYFILTKKSANLTAYRYSTGEKLQKLDISLNDLDLIWKTFIQNDLLIIKDEKDVANFCAAKYAIFGSFSYEFEILSKDKMKKLSYYDPEYYDVACYGADERRKIINSVAAINYVTKK